MNRRSLLIASLSALPAAVVAATLPDAPSGKRGNRISADKDDPGFDPMYMFVTVLFNGEPLEGVRTADEELGTALVWGPSFDKFRKPGYHLLHGSVEIKYPRGHAKNPF